MNRKEMLRRLLSQAQFNGFAFKSWYRRHIQPEWPGAQQALDRLSIEGHYYTLLFSHEFARCFWKTGAQMSFTVPGITYPRVTTRGEVVQVTRKPFTRRTIKADVWKYHLRQMAATEDPIGYLTRFLPVENQSQAQQDEAMTSALPAKASVAARG